MQGDEHLFDPSYFSASTHLSPTPRQDGSTPIDHQGLGVVGVVQDHSLYGSTGSGTSSNQYDPYSLSDLEAAQLGLVIQQHGGGELEDDEEDVGGTPDTVSSDGKRKKSGRPRDRVWDLFDGDRQLASCKYCDWRSEHPKAFRMKAHVQACERIPLDKKRQLVQVEEDKVRTKQLQQEYAAKQQTVSAEVAAALTANMEKKKQAQAQAMSASASGSPKLPQAGPSASKKRKQDHGSGTTVHHGPPPPLSSFPAPGMVPGPSMKTTSATPQPAQSPTPRSPITCHVLDSTSGKPAPDMRIRLDRLNTTGFVLQGQGITDKDGRCNNLLTPGTVLDVGIFKITFFTSEYFTHRGILSFYPFIEIPFEVRNPEEHYHIPCLLAPHSFTTYRGS